MGRKTVEKGISYDDEKGLYYVLLPAGTNADGKSSKSYVTTKKITEARKIRKEHLAKKQRGEVLPASAETLAQHAEAVINFKELKLQESTIYGYRNILKNYIQPYFKNKKIQEVSAGDLEKYVIFIKKKKLSDSTIRKHMDLLYSVFEDAKKKQLVKENPVKLIDRVQPEVQEKTCYNAEETRELLKSVQGTSIEVPVYLAVFLGLRRSEIAGLKWDDVNFEERTITIRSARVQVGQEIVTKKPKTKKSQRKLLMPEVVCQVLQREKNRKPVKGSLAERTVRGEYVANMVNGQPFRPNYISDRFTAHLKRRGLKQIRFHDLRHTFASIALGQGADIYEISASLGHANVHVTTSVYLHELDPVKRGAIEKVAEGLKLDDDEMNC